MTGAPTSTSDDSQEDFVYYNGENECSGGEGEKVSLS